MLSKADAQHLTEQAQQHAYTLGTLLMRLHDGQAWRALDYQSWTAYCEDNFDESLRTIQRYIRRERARELLSDSVNLSRFTGEALEALDNPTDAQICALADIAAKTVDGRIGADVIRSVQAAVTETLVTGAVEGADGEQYAVADVMVAGVQEYQRETFLRDSKREYIVAGIEATVSHWSLESLELSLRLPFSMKTAAELDNKQPLHISIWRELS